MHGSCLTQIEITPSFLNVKDLYPSAQPKGSPGASMQAGDSTLISGNAIHSDEAFQRLLLQFSDAASVDQDENSLIQIFCREARQFFQTSGVYFWRYISSDELVGSQGDGFKSSEFKGFR